MTSEDLMTSHWLNTEPWSSRTASVIKTLAKLAWSNGYRENEKVSIFSHWLMKRRLQKRHGPRSQTSKIWDIKVVHIGVLITSLKSLCQSVSLGQDNKIAKMHLKASHLMRLGDLHRWTGVEFFYTESGINGWIIMTNLAALRAPVLFPFHNKRWGYICHQPPPTGQCGG